MAGGSEPGASLVSRTLDVLGAFDEENRELTLVQIATRANLSGATTLRIVRELVVGGALVRRDRFYTVGRRIWDLGLLSPGETDLREVASPFLHDLHATTRAAVHLAIREKDSALYLDRLSGHESVPVVSRVGSRLPLYSTGVGKVLLAYAPDEVVRRVMSSLEPITPYTITAPGRLARQLAKVHTDGYATTIEEMTLGACSIAVPIHTGDGVHAAIGVVVADVRRNKGQQVSALNMAARAIGRICREGSDHAGKGYARQRHAPDRDRQGP